MKKIHYLNRAQLVDDAWTLAKAGLLEYNIAFDLSSYLSLETDYFAWVSALRHLSNMRNQFLHTEHYENFKVTFFTILFLHFFVN